MGRTLESKRHVTLVKIERLVLALAVALYALTTAAKNLRPIGLKSTIENVQPMTGIVYWATNGRTQDAPIQLEFAYFPYSRVVDKAGRFDWQPVDELLDEVAARKHQAVIRWYDTYVGKPSGVPRHIQQLVGYDGTTAKSEGRPTGFSDWSNQAWQDFALEFFTQFAARYDRDPRLAFLEAGFGLWAEYHIYDGPMELGKTFPSLEYQRKFAHHLSKQFQETPWMVSVDASKQWSPLGEPAMLSALRYGLFDDSFNHRNHEKVNFPNWKRMGLDRWKQSPIGGEFAFYTKADQRDALAPSGPYGIPFSDHAARFHLTFILGDHQPKYQTNDVIRQAGLSCGYRFRVTRFVASDDLAEVTIENVGVAPIYYDAFPAIDGTRSTSSLKGLLPGQQRDFRIARGGISPALSIECDRLVADQVIEFEANLP